MSHDRETLALDEYPSRHVPEHLTTEIEQPALAPADGGKAAWLMLASCCIIQLPVWGVFSL